MLTPNYCGKQNDFFWIKNDREKHLRALQTIKPTYRINQVDFQHIIPAKKKLNLKGKI